MKYCTNFRTKFDSAKARDVYFYEIEFAHDYRSDDKRYD